MIPNFGVRFRYNAIGDVTANNIVAPSQAFNITSGVSMVAMPLSAAYGPISSGATYNDYIGTSTDQDWFKFTTGGTGTISLSLTNLPGDYDLYLYDSSGTQLAASTQSGTTAESISYAASAAGTFYAKVVGYNGAMSTTQAYALTATYPTASSTAPYAFVHQTQLPNQRR